MLKVAGLRRNPLEGVYGKGFEGDAGFEAVQADIEAFAAEEGHRPRMLVVKMGQDGHDPGGRRRAGGVRRRHPPGDYDFLRDIGVTATFGPGTNIPDAAHQVLALLRRRAPLTPSGPGT